MYIFFHGLIFDPSDITVAQAGETSFCLHFAGDQNPVRIWCDEDRATHLAGELYQLMLELGIGQDAADADPEFHLDNDELAALDLAADAGYQYIARDKDGKLFCYQHKPERFKTEYMDSHTPDPRRLDSGWFSEITFENGPWNIDYLRLES